jgi:hypothetical protein
VIPAPTLRPIATITRATRGPPKQNRRFMRLHVPVLVVIALSLAGAARAQAQSRDTTPAKEMTVARPAASLPACCTVVRLDTTRSIFTARETATGYTFRFSVKDRRLQRTLKVGNPVWADFATKKVTLGAADAQPCCAILDTQEKP